MRVLAYSTFTSIFLALTVLADEEFEDFSQSTVILEHSFDQGSSPIYSKRGTISIQSLKNGAAFYTSDGPFSSDDLAQLKRVVREDGIYRLRISSRSGAQNTYISTFIKGCLVYEAGLQDFITISVDLGGNLLGLGVQTDVQFCTGARVHDEDLSAFDTHVHVSQTSTGPVPETQLYIQKIELEKAEKAKGQQADNRSFFGKYWMYIVPLVIFMMFASNADPQQQGGGGGR